MIFLQWLYSVDAATDGFALPWDEWMDACRLRPIMYAPVTGRVPWGVSWVRIVSGRRKTVANRVSRVGNH